MLNQAISIFGALCLLLGYYLSSSKKSAPIQLKSILLNILGSGILTITAVSASQYGFIILEGIWCIISIKNLIKYFHSSI